MKLKNTHMYAGYGVHDREKERKIYGSVEMGTDDVFQIW